MIIGAMLARLFAFAIWAAVTASLMAWALRLFADSPRSPAYTVAVDSRGTRGDFARVFGRSELPATAGAAVPPPPAASSRFKLVGVAAPRDARVEGGLALISVDGKPAKAVGVGRTIDEDWMLRSVSRNGARLASNVGAETLDLEVPPMPAANRGSLPAPGAPGVVPPPPGSAVPAVGRAVTAAPLLPSAGGAAGQPPSIYVPPEELTRGQVPAARPRPGQPAATE